MTDEPIFAWDDRLQRQVCIGISVWNGRELLPDRPEMRDSRWTTHTDSRRSGELLTERDLKHLPSRSWTTQRSSQGRRDPLTCACGQRKTRTAKQCLECRKVHGWNGGNTGRVKAWVKPCPGCTREIRATSQACKSCTATAKIAQRIAAGFHGGSKRSAQKASAA